MLVSSLNVGEEEDDQVITHQPDTSHVMASFPPPSYSPAGAG